MMPRTGSLKAATPDYKCAGLHQVEPPSTAGPNGDPAGRSQVAHAVDHGGLVRHLGPRQPVSACTTASRVLARSPSSGDVVGAGRPAPGCRRTARGQHDDIAQAGPISRAARTVWRHHTSRIGNSTLRPDAGIERCAVPMMGSGHCRRRHRQAR